MGRLSVRDSFARDSWLRQMTDVQLLGHDLQRGEISLTTVTRFSPDLPGAAAVISWR